MSNLLDLTSEELMILFRRSGKTNILMDTLYKEMDKVIRDGTNFGTGMYSLDEDMNIKHVPYQDIGYQGIDFDTCIIDEYPRPYEYSVRKDTLTLKQFIRRYT